ncbi:MAG TPA: IS630 family transposase [Vicinamibacteria bacterium]
METARQPPELHGVPRSRWRVADLLAAVPWARGYAVSGLARALKRLKVGRPRGRLRLHSPDPAYREKVSDIAHARSLAYLPALATTLLYGDEFSLYRQPTLGPAFAPVGAGPVADLSHRRNTYDRYCGALNVATGQLTWLGRSKMGVVNLKRFLAKLRATSPGQRLYLVWDNWPVHAHPEVQAQAARLGIEPLWLPTYAPWLNPIEKLWRWLTEELLRHHRLADRFAALKRRVAAWLDRFTRPAPDLLRYVGEPTGPAQARPGRAA